MDAAFAGLAGEGRGQEGRVRRARRRTSAGSTRCAEPGRTVEKIVDLSRLGEFETCKALTNLLNLGYLRAVGPARRTSTVGAYAQDGWTRLRAGRGARARDGRGRGGARGGRLLGRSARIRRGRRTARRCATTAPQRFLARYQLARLRGALEVYRLERGEYPAALGALVEAGLTTARDLRHPWSQRVLSTGATAEGRFVLLPPVE